MLKESALSIVVLYIVLFSTPIESYMSYALNRIFDTAMGVITALLVNYFLPRPRNEIRSPGRDAPRATSSQKFMDAGECLSPLLCE